MSSSFSQILQVTFAFHPSDPEWIVEMTTQEADRLRYASDHWLLPHTEPRQLSLQLYFHSGLTVWELYQDNTYKQEKPIFMVKGVLY